MKSELDLTRDLAAKAANNLKMAEIGIAHDAPLDTIAFHIQQTAEKLLKALLVSSKIEYPRTYDIDVLLDLVVSRWPDLEAFRERLLGLTTYAVDMRYDAALYPAEDDVRAGLNTVKELRDTVLTLLPPQARP
jgi:HEPN domain-containing protein